ncbi:MAG TPA: tetratricopeptide repeat protein [Tepidisphaeraceae bacterium]|jgi:predicted TPR repeat methyltransferase|nr:tetratricopeptide repeat protein [Tepidisphaeraceae bacterium]
MMNENAAGSSPTPRALSLPDAVALAARLLDENRLAEAEQILAAVLNADANSPDGLHFMGILRCRQNRADEGIALIRQAIAVAPTYAEAHHNLGNIYRALGRPAEALESFRRAIELAPDIAESHLNVADLLRRSGKRAEAVAFYRRALELDPGLSEAHFQLGKIYHRLSRPLDAAATFRNWQSLDPANPVARHMVEATAGTKTMDRASDGYIRCEFDDFADTFDDVMATLNYNGPQQIAAALAMLTEPQKDLRVLDAGCGTGLTGQAVAPWARHLAGVDLSPAMIERARQRGGYDELVISELTAFLQTTSSTFDLAISADTFIYFGVLSEVFRGVARCLKPAGHFIFTVEHLKDGGNDRFLLNPAGRYSHRESYVRTCLEEAGLTFLRVTEETVRLELTEPVAGLTVTAAKLPTAPRSS